MEVSIQKNVVLIKGQNLTKQIKVDVRREDLHEPCLPNGYIECPQQLPIPGKN